MKFQYLFTTPSKLIVILCFFERRKKSYGQIQLCRLIYRNPYWSDKNWQVEFYRNVTINFFAQCCLFYWRKHLHNRILGRFKHLKSHLTGQFFFCFHILSKKDKNKNVCKKMSWRPTWGQLSQNKIKQDFPQ